MHSDPVGACLAALQAASDDATRYRCLEVWRDAILSEPDAGRQLASAIAATEPDAAGDEDAMLLFEVVLDTARMAQENGQPEGARFLAAIDEHLGALAHTPALGSAGRMALGRAYVRASLPPPDHLIMEAEDFAELAEDEGGEVPDIDALLDDLRKQAGAEPMTLHAALSEMTATVPPGARAVIVGQIARRSEEVFSQVGAYWLLDPDPVLRQAAAEGFLDRTLSGEMDAATAARLIELRPWLPGDAARGVLDRVIREGMRREVGGTVPQPWTLHRVLASIPDGAGAQSIAVAAQSGGRRGIAMVLLKQGFGVKDAYVIPCASASEQKRMLARIAEEMGAEEVAREFLRPALAAALGEGMEAGLLPAPGLVEVAGICGLQDLRPEPRSVGELLGGIDPEGVLAAMPAQRLGSLVGRSAGWGENFSMIDSWFEDSAEVRDILMNAITPRTRGREIWALLETRRPWWARMIARTAVTLHAARDPAWLEFAATAHALESGRELKKTPIMHCIADQTLERPQDPWARLSEGDPDETDLDHLDFPAPVAAEKKNELARLLKASGTAPDWVDGYLMGIVVSPKLVAPGRWIEQIVTRVESFADEAALQRLLDIVMLRYNAANKAAPDPATMKARLDGLSERAIAAWTAGFASAAKRFKSSWPARALNKDDKAMLRLLAEAAEDAKQAARLRSMLPAWLAHRHALRE